MFLKNFLLLKLEFSVLSEKPELFLNSVVIIIYNNLYLSMFASRTVTGIAMQKYRLK